MRSIFNMFKLEFLIERREKKSKFTGKKRVISTILNYILSMILTFVVSILAILIIDLVVEAPSKMSYASFIISILQLFYFFFALSTQTKKVYDFEHKMILSNLPILKKDIYLGKTFYHFVKLYIKNLTTTFPILIALGVYSQATIGYYFLSLVATLLMPLIPYALASLIAIPLTFVISWLKGHNFINVSLSVLLTIGVFVIYNILVFNIARIALLEDGSQGNILSDLVALFENPYVPSYWISSFMLSKEVNYFLFIFIGASIILPIAVMFLGYKSYEPIFIALLFNKSNPISLFKVKDNQKPLFLTYFINELKMLIRSNTYAFTYFGMSVAMPIMVWFCNRLMLDFAVDKFGKGIVFGTTLLVMLVFVSIICSPTASLISKEGDSIWILKTSPNGITISLFAKSMVGILVSLVSTIATFIVICSFKYITWGQGAIILGFISIYIVGLVAYGMLLNLKKPNIFKGGREKNSNVITHMITGTFISVCIGVFALVGSFDFTFLLISLIVLAVLVLWTGICVVLLITQNKKLYYKMEV